MTQTIDHPPPPAHPETIDHPPALPAHPVLGGRLSDLHPVVTHLMKRIVAHPIPPQENSEPQGKGLNN